MKDDNENALDSFLEEENEKDDEKIKTEDKDAKKVIIDERSGLIERIDRQYITNDGRILLREQY